MQILHVIDQHSGQSVELATSLGKLGVQMYDVTRTDLDWTAIRDIEVILLDPGLSRDESIAICLEARLASDIPIIMISDRAERVDQLEGFRAGADHYVVEPYHLDELIAKIVAVTRTRSRAADDRTSSQLKTGSVGDMEIDVERMKVTVAGVTTELTKKEFQILAVIIGENGAVCSREKLAAEVWGRPESEVYDSIQVLMSRLRVKLGRDRIETVRSVGYRIAGRTTVSALDLSAELCS